MKGTHTHTHTHRPGHANEEVLVELKLAEQSGFTLATRAGQPPAADWSPHAARPDNMTPLQKDPKQLED